MKAKPYQFIDNKFIPCNIEDATHVEINRPGPFTNLFLPVILRGKRHGTHCWSWNGDTEKPTFKPSVRTTCGDTVCHSWITDGQIQFLDDCTHALRGQTLDLFDVE